MRILITGGLGFIGTNTAIELFEKGNEIFILDNLSRKGNIENFNTLEKLIKFTFWNKDIRNFFDIENIFKNNSFDAVIHLAAQVAVTYSVRNPREDFEINALGTFNILECLRLYLPDCAIIYSSTNKVYGEFKSQIDENDKRYFYTDLISGINENQNLDFHSPYGCSKGTADQYVKDYSRIFNLKSVVLRQSCIYGPNQFGIEDQGWVSWFSISSIFDSKFTIYGNGKQVRDVLHVKDLINCYELILHKIDKCSGNVYNIGGGINNTLSLLELIDLIEYRLQKRINFDFSDWRPGDQKIYISDIGKIKQDIGWEPKISTGDGVNLMFNWIEKNKPVFKKLNII